MLSTDEPITLLIEKLDALATPDRAAILKRLSPQQRQRLERLRTGQRAPAPDRYSPALLERIAELDAGTSPLTPTVQGALRRAAKDGAPRSVPETARGASLADVAGGLFRKRGSA
ncbi:hypothetical protein OK349_18985 [Sphingomonas sp. BT-65]|uniref:hypothetical protein n=1 Tax=Sphingomonas sp. BT-65 TaxID=2989821 RepID=UPI002235894E|nr:hypothetical protein [Sphingomonas sp. BT-65]MCW4463795.1 hypothetical protein [Sphingomonas sp. BT-65]